jgi:tRNA dimethylallyltransferase
VVHRSGKKGTSFRRRVTLNRQLVSLPENTLPIVCGGTHYFIQHFLFPPPELSLSRPSPNGKAASEPLALRWTPPGPQPPISLEPELQSFLDTFWTLDPVWPGTPTLLSAGAGAGPSSSSRPILSEDSQLLALHRLLVAVDPQEAGRWHWRDGRKVRRALERWWERGSGHGEAAQSLAEGDATPKGRHAR